MDISTTPEAKPACCWKAEASAMQCPQLPGGPHLHCSGIAAIFGMHQLSGSFGLWTSGHQNVSLKFWTDAHPVVWTGFTEHPVYQCTGTLNRPRRRRETGNTHKTAITT